MAAKRRPAGSPNITTVRTVEINGSPRHVAKTHGTHNGRLRSWPHLSDALDRPPHLRDLTKVKPVKPVPSRHRRLPHKHIRSTLGKDSLRAHWAPGAPRWDVRVLVDDRLTEQHVYLSVTVTAHTQAEAELLALDLAEYMRPCLPIEASAERR